MYVDLHKQQTQFFISVSQYIVQSLSLFIVYNHLSYPFEQQRHFVGVTLHSVHLGLFL